MTEATNPTVPEVTIKDLQEEMYSRQSGLIHYKETCKYPITIVGAGHVGSAASLMIVKSGAATNNNPLTVIDPDTVGLENMAMQFFKPSQAALNKVDALKDNLEQFGLVSNGVYVADKFDPLVTPLHGIVLSAVDKMSVRKQIFDATDRPECKLFIDVRTAGEYISLYAINPSSSAERAWYLSTWFPDEKGDDNACTERGISWTTFTITGLIGMIIGMFWRSRKYPNFIEFDMCNNIYSSKTVSAIQDEVRPRTSIDFNKVLGTVSQQAN